MASLQLDYIEGAMTKQTYLKTDHMKGHILMRLRAINKGGDFIKKIFFAITCIMFLFVMGCEKTADEDEVVNSRILGSWSISYAKNAVTGEDIPLQHLYGSGIKYGGSLTFHKNSTFERRIGITSDDDTTKGSYSIHDDTITLRYDNGAKNIAIYLPLGQMIEYRQEDSNQSPVYEYYIKLN